VLVDAQLIGAVFNGLVLLLGAVGGLLAVRGKRAAVSRRDHRDLQRRFVVALRHIFALETGLAAAGLDVPPRPAELDEGDEEDAAPTGGGPRRG
jgi:hypothetical protein